MVLAVTFVPAVLDRPVTAPSPTAAPLVARTAATIASASGAAHVLALPSGITDVDLAAMPDRYVNEPLPSSYRIVLMVRGGEPALASVEPPATITWTESGIWYRLTSRVWTIAQLVEVAAEMR